MANIAHVELSDTFNKQRQTINSLIDYANANPTIIPGNGINKEASGILSVKTTGDALSFDNQGNLVGNDAYPDLLTQVELDTNAPVPAPTLITTTSITFPAFTVIFDNKVYYGKKISDFTIVEVPETVMTVEAGENGAVFVYIDTAGEIHQSLNPITPGNSSTQCLLGSYYRLNNQIQANSWAYTPWNGSTSKDTRFITSGSIAGGLLKAASSSTLQRAAVSIVLEGINATTSIYNPNYKEFVAESPYSTKKIWPGYDASVSDTTQIDTTHVYNMTTETVDDVSSINGYIVLLPGIVAPTGQDVYLMAMSPYVSGEYTQIYPKMEDAINSIYGMEVSLGNVASRVVWLKQSIIVKIGATDFTDPTQFQVYGDVPNVLGVYSAIASGGSGSRVSGITVKANGVVIGDPDKKTVLDFDSGFTVVNTSENEVDISLNASAASVAEINTGTDTVNYITPYGLKNQNYLATIEYIGKISQNVATTAWPVSTDPANWPHTILISTNSNYTLPVTQPTYTNMLLTWEVVIKNTANSSIILDWPSSYQAFNGEALPTSIAPNTSIFMMMRKYSNNYTLVSVQGVQNNTLY